MTVSLLCQSRLRSSLWTSYGDWGGSTPRSAEMPLTGWSLRSFPRTTSQSSIPPGQRENQKVSSRLMVIISSWLRRLGRLSHLRIRRSRFSFCPLRIPSDAWSILWLWPKGTPAVSPALSKRLQGISWLLSLRFCSPSQGSTKMPTVGSGQGSR